MVEIDIKVKGADGKMVAQKLRYQPMSEINLAMAIERNSWTVKRLAERMGCSEPAVRMMISGKPSLPTIYKFAWAMQIDPRELFFSVDSEGNIISETQTGTMVQTDQKEGNRLGDTFASNVQDGQEILHCPHCQTAFLVTNVPHKSSSE